MYIPPFFCQGLQVVHLCLMKQLMLERASTHWAKQWLDPINWVCINRARTCFVFPSHNDLFFFLFSRARSGSKTMSLCHVHLSICTKIATSVCLWNPLLSFVFQKKRNFFTQKLLSPIVFPEILVCLFGDLFFGISGFFWVLVKFPPLKKNASVPDYVLLPVGFMPSCGCNKAQHMWIFFCGIRSEHGPSFHPFECFPIASQTAWNIWNLLFFQFILVRLMLRDLKRRTGN